VVRVRGSRDQLRLARAFCALRDVDKILEGTGEYGGFSAVLAGKLGSWMVCCLAGEAAEATPGPPDPRTLEELYRFRQVGPDTALYAVVGNPIAHSRSPQIHNRGLQELGLDAVYVPFLADRLPAFLRAAESLGVRGLSVTMPFKRAALRRARSSDAAARAVGAANTLLWRDRHWLAANTDAAGFLAPLQRLAPSLLAPETQAVVLGAGGAARAVVYALRRCGLRVLILNRTPARARALARRFGCRWAGLEPRALERLGTAPALIVQSTSVGLDGEGDPLPDYRFRGEELVYDLVYGLEPSPLLRRARAAGCRTLDGREMLRAQAAAQFLLFTGRELP
jgi:3-dehydroquinate dehydratase/shikimate dehydrogenase